MKDIASINRKNKIEVEDLTINVYNKFSYINITEKLNKYVPAECFQFDAVVAGNCVINRYIAEYDLYLFGNHDIANRINCLIVTILHSRPTRCDVIQLEDKIQIYDINISLIVSDTKEDILDLFDFGCESFMYDGKSIRCNNDGEYTLLTGFNQLKQIGVKRDYLYKLHRYFNYGFGIELLGLYQYIKGRYGYSGEIINELPNRLEFITNDKGVEFRKDDEIYRSTYVGEVVGLCEHIMIDMRRRENYEDMKTLKYIKSINGDEYTISVVRTEIRIEKHTETRDTYDYIHPSDISRINLPNLFEDIWAKCLK